MRASCSITHATNALALPGALSSGLLHMQKAAHFGNSLLKQGIPQPRARGSTPTIENMRRTWTPALPEVYANAVGREALLCLWALQSVHASTHTH